MRKIGDDAKEDSRANPTIMATIAKSATRAKLKASHGEKKKEKNYGSPYLASYRWAERCGRPWESREKKRKKTADMSSKTDVDV